MPIYMLYPGIDGDVTSKGHEKWIELSSMQFGVSRQMTSPGGSGADREGSTPTGTEVVISKLTDGATTNLMRASVGIGPGAEGQTIKIDLVKTDSSGPEPYLQFELTNALVSSFSLSSGGDRPHESLSINFTKIAVNNIGMGLANETGNPDRHEWDHTTHTGS